MNTPTITNGLIPEWYPQDCVILAWPDASMDWASNLTEVRACYIQIIDNILEATDVLLLLDEPTSVPEDKVKVWQEHPCHRVFFVPYFPLNDTWMRDVMPLFGIKDGVPVAYDYGFNAWGLKFAANFDNTAVRRLFFERSIFSPTIRHINRLDTILEGGAIDVNSRGEVLTTGCVLWEENRNPNYLIGRYDSYFSSDMGIRKVCELEHTVALPGDDTDGHIDTLARFVGDETILYCASNNTHDPLYPQLKAMEDELKALTSVEGKPYRCIPIPVPAPHFGIDGEQLPATYVNFLITNGLIIVPTYADENDDVALEIIRSVLPNYRVVGVDCTALIQQHGSLHCITMQVPKGFINPERKQS